MGSKPEELQLRQLKSFRDVFSKETGAITASQRQQRILFSFPYC